jgi:hypothetical protein
MIDIAFPSFRYLECDALNPWYAKKPQALTAFRQAYLAAWKINQERSINGQKASTDAEVMYHVLQTWNRAHQSGPSDWIFHPATAPYLGGGPMAPGSTGVNVMSGPGWGSQSTACPPNLPPFASTLVTEMQNKGLTQDFARDGSGLLVHTGPVKQPNVVVTPIVPHLAALLPKKKFVFHLGPKMLDGTQTHKVTLDTGASIPAGAPLAVTGAPSMKSLPDRLLPYAPAAAGAALWPVVGPLAPAVGVATTAVLKWREGRKSHA